MFAIIVKISMTTKQNIQNKPVLQWRKGFDNRVSAFSLVAMAVATDMEVLQDTSVFFATLQTEQILHATNNWNERLQRHAIYYVQAAIAVTGMWINHLIHSLAQFAVLNENERKNYFLN